MSRRESRSEDRPAAESGRELRDDERSEADDTRSTSSSGRNSRRNKPSQASQGDDETDSSRLNDREPASAPEQATYTMLLQVSDKEVQKNKKNYSHLPTRLVAAPSKSPELWFSFMGAKDYYPVHIVERSNPESRCTLPKAIVTMRLSFEEDDYAPYEASTTHQQGIFWFRAIRSHLPGVIRMQFTCSDPNVQPIDHVVIVEGKSARSSVQSKAATPEQSPSKVRRSSSHAASSTKAQAAEFPSPAPTPARRSTRLAEEVDHTPAREKEPKQKLSKQLQALLAEASSVTHDINPTSATGHHDADESAIRRPRSARNSLRPDSLAAAFTAEEATVPEASASRNRKKRKLEDDDDLDAEPATTPAATERTPAAKKGKRALAPSPMPAHNGGPVFSPDQLRLFAESVMPPPGLFHRSAKHRLDPTLPVPANHTLMNLSNSKGHGAGCTRLLQGAALSATLPQCLLTAIYRDYRFISHIHAQHMLAHKTGATGSKSSSASHVSLPAAFGQPSVTDLIGFVRQRCGHVVQPSFFNQLRALFEDVISSSLPYEHEAAGLKAMAQQAKQQCVLMADLLGPYYFLRFTVYVLLNACSGEAGSSTRVKGQLFDLEKVVEAAVRMMDDNYLDWFY